MIFFQEKGRQTRPHNNINNNNDNNDNNDNDSDKKPKPNQPTKTFISELVAGVGIA